MPKMKAYFQTTSKSDSMVSRETGKLAYMEPGDRITAARKGKNLSRKDLGELVGVTQQAVGMWERGDVANIRLANLIRLLPALDLTLEQLMTGKEAAPKRALPSALVHTPDHVLTQEEQDLLDGYRILSRDQRDAVWGVVDGFIRLAYPKVARALGPRDPARSRRAEAKLVTTDIVRRAQIEREAATTKPKPKAKRPR